MMLRTKDFKTSNMGSASSLQPRHKVLNESKLEENDTAREFVNASREDAANATGSEETLTSLSSLRTHRQAARRRKPSPSYVRVELGFSFMLRRRGTGRALGERKALREAAAYDFIAVRSRRSGTQPSRAVLSLRFAPRPFLRLGSASIQRPAVRQVPRQKFLLRDVTTSPLAPA
ncbi:hypothetical protein HPB49_005167 [Dermacentor silvarum]|uniref:Uncharacterized protein n=1 Tax=Dermacentor silvarum TaxID=543639 RepID=A0ACB8DN24_DERSI|nr:hypothetical protein HPB49_005167 [Dermacentor silvarum]